MVSNDTRPDRVELWVQPAPPADLEPLLSRLGTLRERGGADEVVVRTWDRYVDAAGPEASATWRRLQRFGRYAGSTDRFAPEVTVGVGRMGPARRVYCVPRVALAEYRDGRLVRLTPCTGEIACVLARLEALTRRTRPATGVPAPAGARGRPPRFDRAPVRNVPT